MGRKEKIYDDRYKVFLFTNDRNNEVQTMQYNYRVCMSKDGERVISNGTKIIFICKIYTFDASTVPSSAKADYANLNYSLSEYHHEAVPPSRSPAHKRKGPPSRRSVAAGRRSQACH